MEAAQIVLLELAAQGAGRMVSLAIRELATLALQILVVAVETAVVEHRLILLAAQAAAVS